MRYYRNQGVNPPVMVREIVKRSTSQVAGVIPFGDATEDLIEEPLSSPSENDRLVETISVLDVLPVARSRRGTRTQRLSHTFDLTDLRADDHLLYYRHDGLRALSGTVPLGAAERRFNYGDGSVLVLTGAVNYQAVEIAGASSNLPTIRTWTPPEGETGYSANANLAVRGKGTGKVQVSNLEIASGSIYSDSSSLTIDVFRSIADTTLRIRNLHADFVCDLDVEGDIIVGGAITGGAHDHEDVGGGGQLDHTAALTNVGTNTHVQIDTHIADTTDPHGASVTLTTPVIGDFTNAGHDHSNAAGGTQLDHTVALTNVGTNTHAQLDDFAKFLRDIFLESFDALVIEDGGTVKMTLEQADGGDLTMVFSDGYTTLDCTPIINITLEEGIDAENPKTNYVYILKSGKVLAKSTTGWPDAEHIKVGFFYIQTAIEVAARGALINQNWNDHVASTSGAGVGQGHLTHLAERSRRLGAIWLDGCEGVATQDGNDLWVSIAVGPVSQAHPHTFSALDSDTAGAGDVILVLNDPDGAYRSINSLNEVTKLSDGTSIGNNKYIKLDLWAVSNKSGTYSPMMLDIPSGQYNTASDAEIDVEGYADFSIPVEFALESTTGFLVASFVCKHTATAMEIVTTIDQRGRTPATAGGAGTGGGDVTAATTLTDNVVIRGDGGAKGVQDSVVTLTDSGVMAGIIQLTVDNLLINGELLGFGGGNVVLGDDLDCNGLDIKDGTRLYVKIADGLWVSETLGVGQNPISSMAIVTNPSGPNVNIGINGNVTYTGTSSVAYALIFNASHDKTNPAGHQSVYGVNSVATNKGVGLATRNIKSFGIITQATNSGAQTSATANIYAYGAYIAETRPGTGANGAGNFYGYGLFVKDTLAPAGTQTTAQEWCALFEGPVQINSDQPLILEGSATSKGDTHLVYDSAGVTMDFILSGTEEMNIGVGVVDIVNELQLGGDLNHDGTNIGFFGTAPAVQAAAYTPTNVNADRSYDADATSVEELADVLGTLIADLQSYGLLQ